MKVTTVLAVGGFCVGGSVWNRTRPKLTTTAVGKALLIICKLKCAFSPPMWWYITKINWVKLQCWLPNEGIFFFFFYCLKCDNLALRGCTWAGCCSRSSDGDVTVKAGTLSETMDRPGRSSSGDGSQYGAADGSKTWPLSAPLTHKSLLHHVPVTKPLSQQLSWGCAWLEGPATWMGSDWISWLCHHVFTCLVWNYTRKHL